MCCGGSFLLGLATNKVDLWLDHLIPPSDWWPACAVAWHSLELRRSVALQRKNVAEAKVAFLKAASSDIGNARGTVYGRPLLVCAEALAILRTNSKKPNDI